MPSIADLNKLCAGQRADNSPWGGMSVANWMHRSNGGQHFIDGCQGASNPLGYWDFWYNQSINEEAPAVLVTPRGATQEVSAPMFPQFTPTRNLDAISDLEAGHAGEHLVCADLLMHGYRAFLTDQTCAYDIVLDISGRLLRIQVKTTKGPKAMPQRESHIPSYLWHVRRAGKANHRVYAHGEFDLIALVALDIGRIAYMLPSKARHIVCIRPPDSTRAGGKRFEQYTLQNALALLDRPELPLFGKQGDVDA